MSSHWNYRVTRNRRVLPALEIREVYHVEGRMGWTARAALPFGETVEELKADLAKMSEAFNHPVLDITDEDNPFEVTE